MTQNCGHKETRCISEGSFPPAPLIRNDGKSRATQLGSVNRWNNVPDGKRQFPIFGKRRIIPCTACLSA